MSDGGESVCDDDDGVVSSEVFDGAGDIGFGGDVECGGGLVEEEAGGVAVESPCDGDALSLAAGESDSAFADECVESVWECMDEVGELSGVDGVVEGVFVDVFWGDAEGDVCLE